MRAAKTPSLYSLEYVKISRPRFWPYLFGPFLIGLAAAGGVSQPFFTGALFVYFTFPANFLIYGINDIFDYETDKHNKKKKGYEQIVTPEKRVRLRMAIFLLQLPAFILLIQATPAARWAFVGFFFFGVFYSVPPIRAKVRPLLDSMFNVLYIFPGLVAYAQETNTGPSPIIFLAAAFWCMAMHAYSAIPDITADKKAKISTIATKLGVYKTLVFCGLCYLLSAGLSVRNLGLFSVVAGLIYLTLIVVSFFAQKKGEIFSVYKVFPYINLATGAALFLWVVKYH